MNEWLAMNEQAGQGREQRFSTTAHAMRKKKVSRTGGTEGGSGPAYPHMYRYGFPVRGFFGGRGGCLRKSEGLRGCGWLPLAGLYRP